MYIIFTELLWNYEFIIMKIYFHRKSDLFMKLLYYENLEPYGRNFLISQYIAQHYGHTNEPLST